MLIQSYFNCWQPSQCLRLRDVVDDDNDDKDDNDIDDDTPCRRDVDVDQVMVLCQHPTFDAEDEFAL